MHDSIEYRISNSSGKRDRRYYSTFRIRFYVCLYFKFSSFCANLRDLRATFSPADLADSVSGRTGHADLFETNTAANAPMIGAAIYTHKLSR